MSRVTCHVSRVTCHMSRVNFFFFYLFIYLFIYFFFFRTKWWSLSVEGLSSTGLPRLVIKHIIFFLIFSSKIFLLWSGDEGESIDCWGLQELLKDLYSVQLLSRSSHGEVPWWTVAAASQNVWKVSGQLPWQSNGQSPRRARLISYLKLIWF